MVKVAKLSNFKLLQSIINYIVTCVVPLNVPYTIPAWLASGAQYNGTAQ